jgi:hypothetical protein
MGTSLPQNGGNANAIKMERRQDSRFLEAVVFVLAQLIFGARR